MPDWGDWDTLRQRIMTIQAAVCLKPTGCCGVVYTGGGGSFDVTHWSPDNKHCEGYDVRAMINRWGEEVALANLQRLFVLDHRRWAGRSSWGEDER